MDKVLCPNCNKTKEIPNRYDENFNQRLTCEHCGFTVAQYCWEFLERVKEYKEEDLVRQTC